MSRSKVGRRVRAMTEAIQGQVLQIGGEMCTREIWNLPVEKTQEPQPAAGAGLITMAPNATAPVHGPLPVGQCVVCFDEVSAHECVDSACGCLACTECMRKWIDEQLDRCTVDKTLRVSCVGCRKMLPQKHALAVSPAAAALADKIDRRIRLECNPLYPMSMQVECPKIGCVGIGYIGFETIMCFLCEHQWSAAGEDPEAADVEKGTMGAVKKCPKCQVKIEKNGGCDHMTCSQCSFQFYWTTLKAYK